ncbi:MAG: DUF2142 domain-containing protein [Rhodoglobus sp.]
MLAPVALWISLMSWAFASPVGSSPDDVYHMASIWCGGGVKEGLCEPGDRPQDRRVPQTLVSVSGCYSFQPEQSAGCEPPASNVLVNTKRGNFTGSYPPVYYATHSLMAGPNVEASIMAMRTVNVTLFVGIISLVFALAPAGLRTPFVWALIATIVPLGMFIVASVNPSSWAVLAGAALWVVLTAFYREKRNARRILLALVAVLLTVMGSGARADSAIYCGVAVLVASALSFEKTRRFAVSSILGLGVIAIALFFFFSAGQSALLEPATITGTVSLTSLIFGNLVLLPELWVGVFGTYGLGWLDTLMPGSVWAPLLFVFGALSFWGMQVWGRRKAVAAAIVAFSLTIVPMYVFVHDQVMVGGYVQPRYIYPLIIMLLGVLLVRLGDPSLGLQRVQTLMLSFLIGLANAIALHFNIRRYVTGTDVSSPNLDAGAEWWWALPIGPIWVWIIGSIAFFILAFLVPVLADPAERHRLKAAVPVSPSFAS